MPKAETTQYIMYAYNTIIENIYSPPTRVVYLHDE